MQKRSLGSAASTARPTCTSTANARMTVDTILNRTFWYLCSFLTLLLCGAAQGETPLFQSRQVTRAGEYTFGIEGPAVDSAGNLYVVNFQRPGTIGKLKPRAAASEFFAALPEGSIGNSIRFALDGRMFIADYKKHNIFVIDAGQYDPNGIFPFFRTIQSTQRHDHCQ